MSIFRSEEHLERWLQKTNNKRGAVLSLQRVWELAKAWYQDPRDPHWEPRSIEQSQAVLSSVGLTGAFWSLK